MSGSLECDLCKTESAVLLQSNLGTGDTIAVGGHCLRDFYANGLQAIDAALADAAGMAGDGSPSGAPDAGSPAEGGTEPHAANVAPMDGYAADTVTLRRDDPDGTYPPGTHGHLCPSRGAFTHKHTGGGKWHEHECSHSDPATTGE
jgi:hypothetical protein